MPIGFILITTEPGREHDVRDTLDGVELVTNRWMLFGEFDLIVRIQADDESALTRCIVENIRTIDGVCDTRTLLGAEL
ncbi:MAG: Lrp/AsnC ligand binding domain-containing protein [Candidatus Poseidoniaceae archaeon]|nr:Lrp/AsnC ligand binding domain-containing protein [Candidatus Poseidoniaceae archaeon]